MKFDICSTHKKGVVIKHFRLQIQAVVLTNPLFHTVMLFPVEKKYLCVPIATHFHISFNIPMVNYAPSCLLFLQAYFLYKRPAWYKTVQDISHCWFMLQTSSLFYIELLLKMSNIKLKI